MVAGVAASAHGDKEIEDMIILAIVVAVAREIIGGAGPAGASLGNGDEEIVASPKSTDAGGNTDNVVRTWKPTAIPRSWAADPSNSMT